MSTAEEITQMLDDIEKRESRLSDWESGFVDSISNRLREGLNLTDKQDQKLTAIWDRVTA